MLSKTKVGTQGLKILFQAYELHQSKDANGVAKDCGYKVQSRNIPFEMGRLDYDKKHIIVPLGAAPITREFTIYHELAHHFLHPVGEIFSASHPDYNSAGSIEYFCDYFGIAMFFAKRGVRIMDNKNYREFLTFGEDAAYDGRDFMSPWRPNLILSQRLQSLTREHFKRNEVSYHECMALKHSFLFISRLIKLRDFE